MRKIISQGAEALISLEENRITKERAKKSYRIPILDEKLRRQRTKKEAKLLEKASKIIQVPKIIKQKTYDIELEYIKGRKLSENLVLLENAEKMCWQIGSTIAKLHDAGIIHGDLTTSNMILSDEDNKLYFIDFGLGFESFHAEDKATDLHVLKEALNARHFQNSDGFWRIIIKSYKKNSKRSEETLKRLEKVEKRGRYKVQY